MKDIVKAIAKRVLRTTRYPAPVRTVLSNVPVGVHLDFDNDVNVERGSYFSGDISISEGAKVRRGCHLSGNITIGSNARLGESCKIVGEATVGDHTNLVSENEVIGHVEIGKCCAIAPRAVFHQTNHEIHKPGIQRRFYADVLDLELRRVSKGPIQIGNDVWMGKNAIVLSGVEIGDGAIIGAGSVVTDDVKPYSIVAGTPATHKKWRFPEHVREQLLDTEWWNWSDEKKYRNREFFSTELTEVDDVTDLIVD